MNVMFGCTYFKAKQQQSAIRSYSCFAFVSIPVIDHLFNFGFVSKILKGPKNGLDQQTCLKWGKRWFMQTNRAVGSLMRKTYWVCMTGRTARYVWHPIGLWCLCVCQSHLCSPAHTHTFLSCGGGFKLLRSRLNRQIWQTWCQYYQDTLNLGLSSLLSGWPWKVLNFQMHLEECDTSDFKSNIWFILNILYIVLSLFIMAPENYWATLC